MQSKGLASGRPNADINAKKASERSFKKAGLNTSTRFGSPNARHPMVGPNSKLVNSQKQYASVQSMLGPQSSVKKTLIQTKGITRSSMLTSGNISTSNLDPK